MIDWRSLNWWDLPGPSRFLEQATTEIAGTPGGVTGLWLPTPPPEGLIDALSAKLVQRTVSQVVRIDASSGLKGRSPTTVLAAAAGVATVGIRSLSAFLDAPALSDVVFIVEGIPFSDWLGWAYSLKRLRSERERRERLVAPSIVVVFSQGISPQDASAAVGRNLRWSGRVSRLDTELYLEQMIGTPDDLASRTGLSVAIEMTGWAPSMAHVMAGLAIEDRIDPRKKFGAANLSVTPHPSWDNGLVDRWDGVTWVSTAVLVANKDMEALKSRLWRGQVRTIFPFLDQVRQAFIAKYYDRLSMELPYIKTFNSRVIELTRAEEFEFYEINQFLYNMISDNERKLLSVCRHMRSCMAHQDPVEGWRVLSASKYWELVAPDMPEVCPGWEFPRCGQKLVIMVGPSGAGKSTLAAHRYDQDDIISSDAIREEMAGSQDMVGDQAPVFERLRERARERLARGQTVVIDATNLNRSERLANARLVPSDIAVEYVVVDRPLEEKRATGGWRLERPNLIEDHSRRFAEALADILNGDGLDNVKVIDKRKPTSVPAAAE